MRPEQEFNQRELRKEVQRRLRFIQTRIQQAPMELSFAVGRTAGLPKTMKLPPPWALESARETWRRVFAPLAKLESEVLSSASRSAKMWELFALFRSMASFIDTPSAVSRQEEHEFPELVTLRKSAAKQVSRKFLRHITTVEHKFNCEFPKPTHEELIEQATGMKRGVTGFLTSDDKLQRMKTATSQIYFLLWYFWPEFSGSLSNPQVHTWLAREHGLNPSDKLVEAILTSLRKAS